MRIELDEDRCVGSGGCVLEASQLFDLTDDGTAVVLDDHPEASLHEAARLAAAACPTGAIHLIAD